jgi:hypothetical protein
LTLNHFRSQQLTNSNNRHTTTTTNKTFDNSRYYHNNNEPNYANTANSSHYATTANSAKTKQVFNKERLTAGGRNSPSSNIVYHYDYLPEGKNIYGRPFSPGAILNSATGNRIEQKKPEVRKSLFSSKEKEPGHSFLSGIRGKSKGKRDVYEFEKKVPMHSSSLEAQKFKTIIFLSGQ